MRLNFKCLVLKVLLCQPENRHDVDHCLRPCIEQLQLYGFQFGVGLPLITLGLTQAVSTDLQKTRQHSCKTFDSYSGSTTRLKWKAVLKLRYEHNPSLLSGAKTHQSLQILAEGHSTCFLSFSRFLWGLSAISLPSEKAVEANLEKSTYFVKSFLTRLTLILVSFSLPGVHPQTRRGGAGVVPHIADPENPHCPQAVTRIDASGRPAAFAFISPKCH